MGLSKIFLIIFIVVIGLFIIGFIFIRGFSKNVDTSGCDDISYKNVSTGISKEYSNEKILELKRNCYVGLALQKLNVKLCDKTKELYDIKEIEKQYPNNSGFNNSEFEYGLQYWSDACKTQVLYLLNNTDIKQCDKILNNNWKASCYWVIVSQTLDPSLCKKTAFAAPENDDDSDMCISAIAIKQKNIDLCKNINQYLGESLEYPTPQGRIDNCYSNYALGTNNSEICSLISGSKDYCYYSIARYTKDPTICGLVTGELKDDCYNDMADILQDESYCVKISKEARGGSLLINCIQNQAVRKKDKKICDNIEPAWASSANLGPLAGLFPSDPLYLRKSCYDAVDRAMGIIVPTPSTVGSPIM